ncbi:MAG: hypothetical protein BRC33_11145 [Cyanobacteria bacterium SW_9_44_58]|nr:MAG: hypothetical protein BRC33_11145 [Cyanobacteria bacterium SW_9_44_58]
MGMHLTLDTEPIKSLNFVMNLTQSMLLLYLVIPITAILERLAAQIAIALQQAQLYQTCKQSKTDSINLNQELEKRVKERTAQLEKANAQLQNELNERIKVDNQLKATNEQLQAVIDAVPGFISWIDSDLNYLGVNQRLANTLNLKPEAFVGRKIGFMNSHQEFGNFIENFFHNKEQTVSQKTIKTNVNGTTNYYLLVAQKYDKKKLLFRWELILLRIKN